MAQVIEELLGRRVTAGLVVTKYGHGLPLQRIQLVEAGHPIPDVAGVRGVQQTRELLKDLGAIPVAYGPGLADRVAVAAPGGVGAALDLVGTDEAWDVSMGMVSDKARIATIVAFGRGLQAGIKVLGGAPGADPGTEIRERARLELARLAQDGKLRVLVSQTFPLAEAAAAHDAILDGHTTGKIALIP